MYSADEQLVSQTLAGDRDAFGVLVHKYQDMVFAYAFQKVRNEADAQDVTQEVFLRAYRNLYALRQSTSIQKLVVYNHVQRMQPLAGARCENSSA